MGKLARRANEEFSHKLAMLRSPLNTVASLPSLRSGAGSTADSDQEESPDVQFSRYGLPRVVDARRHGGRFTLCRVCVGGGRDVVISRADPPARCPPVASSSVACALTILLTGCRCAEWRGPSRSR